MKLPHRRQFLHLAVGAAALPALSRRARAQAYPARPVRIIVGFPPGGSDDIVARLIGQWLAERLAQPVIIENRPGAGTNIATEAVVRAAPDGYTLLLINAASAVNATFYDKLNFNFIRDIVAVGGIARVPNVVLLRPTFPAATILEFIAYAKANPGRINFGSPGPGTIAHVAGELFKMMTGIDIVHVPYRGGAQALTDILAGQLDAMFPSAPSAIENIKAGKLRGLAVTGPKRTEVLPNLPAVDEFVPGYEASSWYGIGAPTNTPTEIIDRINREINSSLTDPRLKTRLADLSGSSLAGSPADFAKLIADETEKWGRVIKFAGIKAE